MGQSGLYLTPTAFGSLDILKYSIEKVGGFKLGHKYVCEFAFKGFRSFWGLHISEKFHFSNCYLFFHFSIDVECSNFVCVIFELK